MRALEAVCREGPHTRDVGGGARTTEVGDAVVTALGRFTDATADDPAARTILV
jgi:hypothetical protein